MVEDRESFLRSDELGSTTSEQQLSRLHEKFTSGVAMTTCVLLYVGM